MLPYTDPTSREITSQEESLNERTLGKEAMSG